MARKRSALVPSDINEQYYQISAEVLNSFPKYRLPIALYVFVENICVLQPYSRRDQRLTNEQIEEIQKLCRDGLLFVSRADFPIYSEHIIKQLDLILQDEHLTDAEVADLCVRSITLHYTTFNESPVKINFTPLYESLMAVTEWIWQDKFRLRVFIRRLPKTYSLPNHAFNSMIMGCWLWLQTTDAKAATRRGFDRIALAFLLHDIGMAKIPIFILQREKKLTTEERMKVKAHPALGYKIMQKLDLAFDELAYCLMEHHERIDGSGYPQGAKEKQISPLGKMCAVVDTFCSMISERPHSPRKTMEEAAKELAANTAQFDKTYTAKILIALVSNQLG